MPVPPMEVDEGASAGGPVPPQPQPTPAAQWLSPESEDEATMACYDEGMRSPRGPAYVDGLELHSFRTSGYAWPSSAAGGPKAILTTLEQWLQSPMGAASCQESSGFVAICDAVSMCADLRELTDGALAPVAEAVHSSPPSGPLVLDAEGRSVRLRGLRERVCMAAEGHFLSLKAESASLLDLLCATSLEGLLEGIPDSPEQLQTLRDSLVESELLVVQGSRVVLRDMWGQPADWWPAAEPEGWPATVAWSGQPEQALLVPWAQGGQACMPAAWDARAAWWGGAPMAGKLPKRRRDCKDRNEWLSTLVTRILEDPSGDVLNVMEPDGSVLATELVKACPTLADKIYGKPSHLIRAILATSRSCVTCDIKRHTVRLKSLSEKLCDVCEEILMEKVPSEATPLGELLLCAPIQAAFSRAPASSTEGESTQAALLRQALEDSDFLEIVEEAPGLHMVSLKPAGQLIRHTMEDVLDHERKARNLLAREGEAPLSWIGGHPLVSKYLARAGLTAGSQACQDALREAVTASERYTLDEVGMSVRKRTSEDLAVGAEVLPEPAREEGPAEAAPECTRKRRDRDERRRRQLRSSGYARRSGEYAPTESQVRKLRRLLGFYFDMFNVQHNQILLCLIEAQRRQPFGATKHSGYLHSKGQGPVFRLKDLMALPRIATFFNQYPAEVAPLLLSAAAAGDLGGHPLPFKFSFSRGPGVPRGAWAAAEARLELNYVPDIRFLEAVRICPEIKPLLVPAADGAYPVRVLPPHAVCIASYSVSSDLSHNQSPKAMEVNMRVTTGSLDPGLLTWESRQQRICRQLNLFDPDIICIQGLQSVGFAERCSEWQPEWFCFEDEPASNHLVHLYRQVSKANYGVAFAPTMKLPGSAAVCFGNAIFWKRSRWQVEHVQGMQNTAVCVELSSRLVEWRLAVCSSKSAAVYAHEWGDKVADEDLAKAVLGVQQGLAEAVSNGCQLVWCGDFGVESVTLLSELKAALPDPPAWQNACKQVLGEDPWTSVATHTGHKAVDLILHDDGLSALGALGGMQDEVSMADFLKAGFPSDHLMQLAVLVNPAARTGVDIGGPGAASVVADPEDFPALGGGSAASKEEAAPSPAEPAWPRTVTWPKQVESAEPALEKAEGGPEQAEKARSSSPAGLFQ